MSFKSENPPSNPQYSFNSPRHQNFSLQIDVIPYIINNCDSSKVFEKLQQTCKYFFDEKKVIVVDGQCFSNRDGFSYMSIDYENPQPMFRSKTNFQYWISNIFHVYDGLSNSLKHLYRCNLKSLKIYEQNLLFREICFLLNGGNIEDLRLDLSEVKYEDGTPVTMDIILSKCPKIRKLWYCNYCEIISTETFERLNSLIFSNKVKKFTLFISQWQYENQLDPRTLSKFIKINGKNTLEPRIKFVREIPAADFDIFKSTVKSIRDDAYLTKIIFEHIAPL